MRICIMGGDRRDLYLAKDLDERGLHISISALARAEEFEMLHEEPDPTLAAQRADILICPVAGADKDGVLRRSSIPVHIPEVLRLTRNLRLLLIGSAAEPIAEVCREKGIVLVESMSDDELAILNSVPSAEGAVKMAMERIDYTIHGSRSLVMGFGRTGQTLAGLLSSMGSETAVAARKPSDRARVSALSMDPIAFDGLDSVLDRFDLIFNTIPALVLNEDRLRLISKGAVIIDLASPPGGVDYSASKSLRIEAALAPGLPGIVAPRTAGRILATVIPRLIREAGIG